MGSPPPIRGLIIILLTKVTIGQSAVTLPLDICRTIYDLRRAGYDAAYWSLMGLHYSVVAHRRLVISSPPALNARVFHHMQQMRRNHIDPNRIYVRSHARDAANRGIHADAFPGRVVFAKHRLFVNLITAVFGLMEPPLTLDDADDPHSVRSELRCRILMTIPLLGLSWSLLGMAIRSTPNAGGTLTLHHGPGLTIEHYVDVAHAIWLERYHSGPWKPSVLRAMRRLVD